MQQLLRRRGSRTPTLESLACAGLCLVIALSVGCAAGHYVARNGVRLASLAEVAKRIEPGDVITLGRGRFCGPLPLKSDVTVSGSGAFATTVYLPGGGPVASAVAAFDIDNDGKAEAFVGMDDGFVRCSKAGKGNVWRANVGGSATAIAPFDVDGDGKPEMICSSESFSIYAFDSDGKQLWRTELPEAVRSLVALGDSVAAACDDGYVYFLSRDGKITEIYSAGTKPDLLASKNNMIIVAAGSVLAAIIPGEGRAGN